jgi:hypothetical protein
LPDGLLQQRLHLELQIAVDRRDDGRSHDGRPLIEHAARDRLAIAADLHRPLAGRPRQEVLILELEAGEPFAVDADEADDLCADRSRRVEALGDVEEPDPGQRKIRDAFGHVGRDLTAEVHERRVRRERFDERAHALVEDRRQLSRGAPRIVDISRVRIHVDRGHREREPATVRVEDLAPIGGQHEGPKTLVGRPILHVPGLSHREHAEADHDRDERKRHDGEQRDETADRWTRHAGSAVLRRR